MSEPLPAAPPAELTALDPIVAGLAGGVLGAVWAAYDSDVARTAGLVPPCVAGLIAGAGTVADYCCAGEDADGDPCMGQLTVRVSNVYPTEQFPVARQSAIPAYGSSWAVELEVAVLRCAPVMDEDGTPPSMADQQASAEQVMGDAGLIRQACAAWAVNHDQAHYFGQLTPLGPEGGCVGSAVLCTYLVE